MRHWIKRTFIICILSYLAVGSAIYAEQEFRHDMGVIREQAKNQSPPLWQYPLQASFKQLDPTAGLSGLVRPEPVPSRMKSIEPPFIAGMRVISDGSIICVIPLEEQFESARYLLAKYWRDTITRIKIVSLDRENGTEKWSLVVSASGIFDFLETSSALLFQARNYDTSGHFVVSKLIALERGSGHILWDRDFNKRFGYFVLVPKENLAVIATIRNFERDTDGNMEAIDISTGMDRWTVAPPKEAADSGNNIIHQPFIVDDRIVSFEDGITCRKLNDGKVIWV